MRRLIVIAVLLCVSDGTERDETFFPENSKEKMLNVQDFVGKLSTASAKNFEKSVFEEMEHFTLMFLEHVKSDDEKHDYALADSVFLLLKTYMEFYSEIPDGWTKTGVDGLIEELKQTLNPISVKLMMKSIQKKSLGKDFESLVQNISLVDSKYFRELCESVVENIYRRDFDLNIVMLESLKSVIPKLIMTKSLYEKIANVGFNTDNVAQLLHLRKIAKNTANDTKSEEIWKTFPDTELDLIRYLKDSLLTGFYKNIDNFAFKIFEYDSKIYEKIIRNVVDDVYGKTDTIELLVQFREAENKSQRAVCYNAVYENMLNHGDIEINSETVGILLTLNRFVWETGIKFDKTIPYASYIRKIHDKLSDIKGEFTKYAHYYNDDVAIAIKYAIYRGQYKNKEFSTMLKNLEAAPVAGFSDIMDKVMFDLFDDVHTETLLDIIESQEDVLVRLKSLFALHHHINRNNKIDKNDPYLFDIARSYKRIQDSKEYNRLSSSDKSNLEKYKLKLHFSIMNTVFGEKLNIRNLGRGCEYLFLDETDVFTWVPGTIQAHSDFRFEATEERNVFQIINVDSTSRICASEKKFGLDSQYRMVFSYQNEPSENDECMWRLKLSSKGLYIKSVEFEEYLIAGSLNNSERRHVFTWRTIIDNPDDLSFIWAIEEFTLQ